MCRAHFRLNKFERVFSPTMAASVAFALVVLSLPQVAYSQHRGQGKGKENSTPQKRGMDSSNQNHGNAQKGFGGKSSAGGTLTPAMTEQLTRMREEEKLARDVYITLARTSGLQIFERIAKAESQHMHAVSQLTGGALPANAGVELPVGNFVDPQFQALYGSLVASGNASPVAALTVGVRIEEMDIRDLQALLSQNPPQNIARVLEHLQQASKNHLRAFSQELGRMGGAYTPEFLNQQEFNKIVNSNDERGNGMGQSQESGNRQGKGGAKFGEQEPGPKPPKGRGNRGGGRG